MNNGKLGAPFQYSDSYVQFLAFLKIGFKIRRMVQGIVRGLSEYVKIVNEIHFTHIRRRMIRIKPDRSTASMLSLRQHGQKQQQQQKKRARGSA